MEAVLLRLKFQNTRDMDKQKQPRLDYERYSDLTAKVITVLGKANLRTMRGKALLNAQEQEIIFQENTPRGKRSVEVSRTQHSRLVRRPDGDYTLTFRFGAKMKYPMATLVSEMRNAVASVLNDVNKGKEVQNG